MVICAANYCVCACRLYKLLIFKSTNQKNQRDVLQQCNTFCAPKHCILHTSRRMGDVGLHVFHDGSEMPNSFFLFPRTGARTGIVLVKRFSERDGERSLVISLVCAGLNLVFLEDGYLSSLTPLSC
jgi:hypothetical protein